MSTLEKKAQILMPKVTWDDFKSSKKQGQTKRIVPSFP